MRKSILFALIGSVCLLAVFAADISLSESEELDYDLLTDDESTEFDFDSEEVDDETNDIIRRIFSHLWRILRRALRTMRGLDCIIKSVPEIEDIALQFNEQAIGCGDTTNKQVKKVIDLNSKIIKTCKAILSIKSSACKRETSGKLKHSCRIKSLHKIWSLYRQTKKGIKLANKIPRTGEHANNCMSGAINNLTAQYSLFPSQINACS